MLLQKINRYFYHLFYSNSKKQKYSTFHKIEKDGNSIDYKLEYRRDLWRDSEYFLRYFLANSLENNCIQRSSNSMHLEERQTIGEEKVEERSNIPVLETFFSSKLFLNNIFPLPYHACTTPSFEIRFLRYPLLGFIHASLYSRFPRKHVF